MIFLLHFLPLVELLQDGGKGRCGRQQILIKLSLDVQKLTFSTLLIQK